MANWATLFHTDINGRPQWFDLLITVGDYTGLDFAIPTIKHWLQYDPGTVIAFLGQMIEHGVGQVEGKQRVLSYYM